MNASPPAPAGPPGRAATLDFRVLRALPFAVVCLVVSAFGHGLAGGGTVPAGTLLLGGLAVWAAATALAGRERALPGIVAGLAVGQLALHLLFHTVGMGGGTAMASTAGPHTMPGMSGMAGMDGMAGMEGMPGMAETGLAAAAPAGFWSHAVLGLTPAMLTGHLLAALAAGWWLRRGEAALWRTLLVSAQLTETRARTWAAPLRALLAGALTRLRALLSTLAVRTGTRIRTVGDESRRLPRSAQLRHQVVRRGPPAPLTA